MKISAILLTICFITRSYGSGSDLPTSGIPNIEEALKAESAPPQPPRLSEKQAANPSAGVAEVPSKTVTTSDLAHGEEQREAKQAIPRVSQSDFAESDVSSAKMPSSLKFDQVPLESVVRIIRARLGVPISIEANPSFPISGDFGNMDLRDALRNIAKQAGLAVVALPAQALALTNNPAAQNISGLTGQQIVKSVAYIKRDPQSDNAALRAAAQRRIDLLKVRQALILEDDKNRVKM